MPFDYDDFILKQMDWRGEVRTKLKEINKDIQENKDEIRRSREENKKANKELQDKIDQLRKDMTNMRIKNATLYGSLSVILAIAVSLVTNGLLG